MSDLFTPLTVGPLELPNRVLMAPLTRARAEPGHVPGPLMATHYQQRASAGLLIAEATMVMEGNSAFWHEPGIHSAAQVAGWRLTTEAVHAAWPWLSGPILVHTKSSDRGTPQRRMASPTASSLW